MDGINKVYVGLDVHKKYCYATMMDEKGETLCGRMFLNTIGELDRFIESIPSEDAEVVLEASTSALPVYDHLESKGLEMHMAHPLRTKAIASAKVKTDKIDSKVLADLLRMDGIPEAYVPSKEIRGLRDVVRHRISLVRMRTQIKNRIHAILAKEGTRHNFSDLFGRLGMFALKKVKLNKSNRIAMNNFLDVLEVLNAKIDETTKYIEDVGKEMEDVKLLVTIPGIGIYSAVLVIAEIGDVSRFLDHGKLTSYAGLTPRVYQSGSVNRTGHITKQGSKWLRWILVQCAHSTVRSKQPNHLQTFYHRKAKKRGNKIAITATARKLLKVAYYMLQNNEPFKPEGKNIKVKNHGVITKSPINHAYAVA